MSPLPDHTTATAASEQRALIEELLAAQTPARRRAVLDALRLWCEIHCAACHGPIEAFLRRRGEAYCLLCSAPLPPPNTDDVPF